MQLELSMRKILLGNNGIIVSNSKAHYIEDGTVPQEYRKLTGIIFDSNVYYETSFKLEGSDTLKFAFSIDKACNVLGCYSSTNANNNYSLYASGSSGAKYMRYNGGTYNSAISLNTRYDVEVTQTGTNGFKTDSTWEQKNFITDNNMLIGTTSTNASSSKLDGILYGNVEVVDKGIFIPVERISDGAIGYYEVISGEFLDNKGTGTPRILGYAQ